MDKITGTIYAIFRVGEKKYKTINELKGFKKHMERTYNTPNANKNIKNKIIIGNEEIEKNTLNHIKGIKLRKNGVLARDLLLTASPEFFINANEKEIEKWISINTQWLKDNFGENIIYAVLHKDEKTYHIHALLIPRFYDNKKGKFILANSRLFDGKVALSKWQDNYCNAMKNEFNILQRGIKNSKAKHIKIMQFYKLINEEFNEKNYQQVIAKAKNQELLKIKIKDLNKTLKSYQNYISNIENKEIEKEKIEQHLMKDIKNLKEDKELFKETIKALSQIYNIPQRSITEIIKRIDNKINKEKENPIIDKEKEIKKEIKK